MDWERTLQLIRDEEGLRLEAYQCTVGAWTVGYGHNLEAHGVPAPIASKTRWSLERAEFVLRRDAEAVLDAICQRLPWFGDLDDVRQAVLVSTGFQMGVPGLLKFKNTLAYVARGDYVRAADGMMCSLWARQTPARAHRHADMMRYGEWS